MISGYGPSGPLGGAGGNATRTSIGTPSKVLTVLRAVPPGFPAIVWSHSRTPLPCTAQGIGFGVAVKTLVIVAFAAGASANSASTASAGTNNRAFAPVNNDLPALRRRTIDPISLLSRIPIDLHTP